MAAAVPFLQIAGTVISVAGHLQSGRAANATAKYNARVAERNAVIARQQAGAAEAAHRRDVSRRMGSIRAGFGASGVTLEGTPLEVLEDSAAMAELDALNIRYQGELRAIGFKDEAVLARAGGKQALTESRFRAASALFSGAGKMFTPSGKPKKKDDLEP